MRLRRDFHQHPELSHEEQRTARVSAAYLADLGLAVQQGIAGQGVTATLHGARPGGVVAFRADMDALPIGETVAVPWRSRVDGVMHACGHDFHLSLALGAARLLAGFRDRLAGSYRFILQPAEEGPSGGPPPGPGGMVAAGVLDEPPVDAILGLHVAPPWTSATSATAGTWSWRGPTTWSSRSPARPRTAPPPTGASTPSW